GAVNDARVAAAHVRAASAIKRRGRLRIERELAARGVDKATARAALETLPPENDAAAIRQILQRKRFPARPTPAERRRMFAHLMRRGFAGDVIARVLGNQDDDAD